LGCAAADIGDEPGWQEVWKMEWSKGWAAACVIALSGLLAAIYVDGESAVSWLAARQAAEIHLIGSAIGVAVSCVIGFLAFIMFESSLAGNMVVTLMCAAWLVKLYFWG
jgi:hypothetical protein